MLSLFPEVNHRIAIPRAGLVYFENFFGEKSLSLMENLKNTIEWKEEEIFIFGRKLLQPRLLAWYGDRDCSYKYSGVTHNPKDWTSDLIYIKESVESRIKAKFNSVLLNYYRNGRDSMGWHSDDEPELGENPVIASVSFGATRIFKFKPKKNTSAKKFSIELTHDSLLVMQGSTQKYWLHSLPKSEKISASRINLTFRKILPKRV